MAVLNLAATSAPFTADPTILIKDYLDDSWNIVPKPKFDTKFANMSHPNQVVIKPMIAMTPPGVLGASRFDYTHAFKIHVWCSGPGAKNNKFKIEQEVERILQVSVLGLFTSGIERLLLDSFEEVETGTSEAKLNEGIAIDTVFTARSKATLKAYYTKVVA